MKIILLKLFKTPSTSVTYNWKKIVIIGLETDRCPPNCTCICKWTKQVLCFLIDILVDLFYGLT